MCTAKSRRTRPRWISRALTTVPHRAPRSRGGLYKILKKVPALGAPCFCHASGIAVTHAPVTEGFTVHWLPTGFVAKILVDAGVEVAVGAPVMVLVEEQSDVAAFAVRVACNLAFWSAALESVQSVTSASCAGLCPGSGRRPSGPSRAGGRAYSFSAPASHVSPSSCSTRFRVVGPADIQLEEKIGKKKASSYPVSADNISGVAPQEPVESRPVVIKTDGHSGTR